SSVGYFVSLMVMSPVSTHTSRSASASRVDDCPAPPQSSLQCLLSGTWPRSGSPRDACGSTLLASCARAGGRRRRDVGVGSNHVTTCPSRALRVVEIALAVRVVRELLDQAASMFDDQDDFPTSALIRD